MKMDKKDEGNVTVDFWSMCDIANAGNCRTVFEDAFRSKYGLPTNMTALPPMPEDGDQWSTLHSWVMPAPSSLEFVMSSRMFSDSLDSLNQENYRKKHCYCRVLELLVNVWAYHSARMPVYVDPITGEMKEQHPIDQRTGKMWAKYFQLQIVEEYGRGFS